MMKENYDYFVKNHDSLFGMYPNKYLIIKDKKVIDTEDTMKKAIEYVDTHNFKSGEYIIQLCTLGDSAYTSSFCSQIICK